MLVQIGQRAHPTDVVDLLYECHGRIRRFLVHSRTLARSLEAEEHAVRATAEQIARYFTTAFPLHVDDENESVIPRLVGRTEALDAALARIRSDHEEHACVERLIAICRDLAREPRRLAALAESLAATSDRVALDLEPHLRLEETVIFPEIRKLSGAARDAIHAEMRARRDVALDRRRDVQAVRDR